MDEEIKTQYLAEVNELIQSRTKNIFSNYPIIREIFKNQYEGVTELNRLRYEISICIIFGLYQSLIVETCSLESIYQRKLATLEALKKSILHQAFSGELLALLKANIKEIPAISSRTTLSR
jgi:hypothetical protein